MQPSVLALDIVNKSELDLCFLGKSWCWGMVIRAITSDKACGLAGVCLLCEVVLQEHHRGVSGGAALVQIFSGMKMVVFTNEKHTSPGTVACFSLNICYDCLQ